MATYTKNYKLTKPDTTDNIDVTDLNGNADIIDQALQALKDGKQDGLTFDTEPTAGSKKPVTSDGIKNYVDDAVAKALEKYVTKEDASGYMGAVLKITFGSGFSGQTYTVTGGGESYSGVVPADLVVRVTVKPEGLTTYTISSMAAGAARISEVTQDVQYFGVYPVTLDGGGGSRPVSWAEGTDEQIVAIVAALDAGTLSVEDTGWTVGDERTVSLSAMAETTGVDESHVAQDVTLVLGNVGGKFFEDGTECHFVVLQKDSLKEAVRMDSIITNSNNWEKCVRRTWCNDVYSAAIPATLLPIFKRFKNISGVGGGAPYGTQETVDLFALAGEGEIFDSRAYAFSDEFSAETQFEWYKTFANRIKKLNGADDHWAERSPVVVDGTNDFCAVSPYGGASTISPGSPCGIAPFGCI